MTDTSDYAHAADGHSNATCPQCGAVVPNGESCADRFALLLALDHSRQEPWGTRHGIAFSVYTLQHSDGAEYAALNRCWSFLQRAGKGEDAMKIATSVRALHAQRATAWGAAPMPRVADAPRSFGFTIADMGDFDAEDYAQKLEAWCKATLGAWTGSHYNPLDYNGR